MPVLFLSRRSFASLANLLLCNAKCGFLLSAGATRGRRQLISVYGFTSRAVNKFCTGVHSGRSIGAGGHSGKRHLSFLLAALRPRIFFWWRRGCVVNQIDHILAA